MFLSSLPGTNRNIKQHSVITAWQLPVKLAAGYWVPTETWNNTQLLLRGNYLLYWMMLTGYPQKHETALSYYHVAITCYTGCWLLGTHKTWQQLRSSCLRRKVGSKQCDGDHLLHCLNYTKSNIWLINVPFTLLENGRFFCYCRF